MAALCKALETTPSDVFFAALMNYSFTTQLLVHEGVVYTDIADAVCHAPIADTRA